MYDAWYAVEDVEVYEVAVDETAVDVVGGNPNMSSRFVLDQFRLKPYWHF